MKELRFYCLVVAVWFVTVAATWAEDALSPGDQALQKLLGPRARTVRLWPDKAPDEPRPVDQEKVWPLEKKFNTLFVTNVTQPSITILGLEKAGPPTPAVVACPGGGYGSLGIELDGAEIVKWLNSQGITGMVLKYRVPKRHQGFPQHHHALQDAQRAMGLIRQHARQWNIDPRRVGMIGFSAGGHLAAALSNNYTERLYARVDAADDLSCRPDFVILIYPAYLTDPIESDTLDPLQHADRMSRTTTPPTFVAVAQADKFARGAAAYYMALRQARVPGEVHIYDGGGHGNALRLAPMSEFAPTCARWLGSLWEKAPRQ
jgi:acetyl esterase/lipase